MALWARRIGACLGSRGLGCGQVTRFWRMSRVEGMLRLEVGDFCACGDGES